MNWVEDTQGARNESLEKLQELFAMLGAAHKNNMDKDSILAIVDLIADTLGKFEDSYR